MVEIVNIVEDTVVNRKGGAELLQELENEEKSYSSEEYRRTQMHKEMIIEKLKEAGRIIMVIRSPLKFGGMTKYLLS